MVYMGSQTGDIGAGTPATFDIDRMPRGGPDASCLDRLLQTDRPEYLDRDSDEDAVNEARKLLVEKAALRNAELAATERHLDRLREGRPDTIETTSLHLDVLRDLRRIHSYICSVACPVLDAAGELAAYRAADSEAAAAAALPAAGR